MVIMGVGRKLRGGRSDISNGQLLHSLGNIEDAFVAVGLAARSTAATEAINSKIADLRKEMAAIKPSQFLDTGKISELKEKKAEIKASDRGWREKASKTAALDNRIEKIRRSSEVKADNAKRKTEVRIYEQQKKLRVEENKITDPGLRTEFRDRLVGSFGSNLGQKAKRAADKGAFPYRATSRANTTQLGDAIARSKNYLKGNKLPNRAIVSAARDILVSAETRAANSRRKR